MSKTMNRVMLMGHLSAKPEIRQGKNGPWARLGLATKHYRGPDLPETTDWHSIFVFGKEAERCNRWLDTGAHLLIEGSLSYWQLDTEQVGGEKQYKNAIHADRIHFLTYKGKKLEDVDNSGTPRNHNAVAQLQ